MIVITAPVLIILCMIGLGAFYFLLVLGNAINTRRLRKKYKEDQDLSKHGEENRKKTGRIPIGDIRERYPSLPTGNRESVVERQDESARRELLQVPTSATEGSNQPVIRKNSSRIGRIFERRKSRGI